MSYRHLMIALISAALIGGCAQKDYLRDAPDMDAIYDAVNNSGQRDTVDVLRQGLMARPELGGTEAYYPIRYADVIAPVWNAPFTNPATGVRHGGRWDYIVIQESEWAH